MQKIDTYLDDLFKENRTKEALELKEEMKQHLIDEVEALKTEGLDEEKAIVMALNSFGDNNTLKKELSELLDPSQKVLSKAKFYIIIGSIVGIIVVLLGFLYSNNYNRNLDVFVSLDELNNYTIQIKGNKKYYEYIELTADESIKYIEVIKLNKFTGDIRIYNNINISNETNEDEIKTKSLDVKVLDQNEEIIADASHLTPSYHYRVAVRGQECFIVIKK